MPATGSVSPLAAVHQSSAKPPTAVFAGNVMVSPPLPRETMAAAAAVKRRAGPGSLSGGSLGRLDQPDVQLAQLPGADGARRAHHQVLGLLVHREDHDLADVGLVGQQHDNPVDAR